MLVLRPVMVTERGSAPAVAYCLTTETVFPTYPSTERTTW